MKSKDSGTVILELALTFVVIFLLLFGGIELSRVERTLQTINSLSREVANSSYRECIESAAINTCLQQEANRMKNLGKEINPSIEVITSIWEWDGANCVQKATYPSGLSKIGTEDFYDTALTLLGEVCRDHGNLAFGEVTAPYQSTSRYLRSFLRFDEGLYAIALF